MRRAARFVLRNWPLKLGAILLATVLYSGLVLSQNIRTFDNPVPIDVIRPPADATVLTDIPPVTVIRYRAPLDFGIVSPDDFSATVDLSRVEVEPGGPPVSVPVTLVALDRRIQVVDFVPQAVEVRLDPVEEREIPVTVTTATVPEGVNVGPPQVDPAEALVRGASSRVATVRSVVARVPIDASALSVDRMIDLTAVDDQGNQVPNVVVEPARARVRIAVARELASRTLPVVVSWTGEPAPGYRITSITVEPDAVTVSGEEATVGRLETATTAPIDLAGRERDFETVVPLALPESVSVSGPSEVRVAVSIVPEAGSRTLAVGVVLNGARSDRVYTLAAPQVNVTLSGLSADLAAVDPSQIVAMLDVASLDVGTHQVPVDVTPPAGLQLNAVAPSEVTVVVQAPLQTPVASPAAGSAHLTAL